MKRFLIASFVLFVASPVFAQRGGHAGALHGGGGGLHGGGAGLGGARLAQPIRPGRSVLPTPTRAAVNSFRRGNGFGFGGRGFGLRGSRGFGLGGFGLNAFNTLGTGAFVGNVFVPLPNAAFLALGSTTSFATLAEFNAALTTAGFAAETLATLPTTTQQFVESSTSWIPVTTNRTTTVQTQTSVGAAVQGATITRSFNVMPPCNGCK